MSGMRMSSLMCLDNFRACLMNSYCFVFFFSFVGSQGHHIISGVFFLYSVRYREVNTHRSNDQRASYFSWRNQFWILTISSVIKKKLTIQDSINQLCCLKLEGNPKNGSVPSIISIVQSLRINSWLFDTAHFRHCRFWSKL